MAERKLSSEAPARKTGTLTAHIVNEIGSAIVTQRYTETTAFPVEAEIARQFSASRPIVREAVKMLTAKGLVRPRQRAGTAVQPESEWNLLDADVLKWLLEREFSIDLLIEFTDIRMAIEPRAAALAANYASGTQRRDITHAMTRMFAAEDGHDDALEADIAFHTAVLNASNNRFVRQFTGLAETALRFSIRRTNAYAGVARASAADHQRVARAIVEGDPARASKLMNDLIQGALNLLLTAGSQPARKIFGVDVTS